MADPDDAIDTVPEMLEYRAKHDGDRRAFRFYDTNGFVVHLTPREIYSKAGKFSHLLRSWGFEKGDVIASGLSNSPERIITNFGVIMAGCVLANCQVIEKDGSDFWHTARISHCRGVILPARPDSAPYRIFSNFIQPDVTADVTSSATTRVSNLEIVHDVSIPQAPTLRKVIICDRNSPVKTIVNAEGLKEEGKGVEDEETERKTRNDQEEQHQNRDKNIETTNEEKYLEQQPQQQHQQQQQQQQDNEVLNTHHSSILEELDNLDDVTEFYHAKCDPSDLVLLLGTSGSTGFNKLIPNTHHQILSYGRKFGKRGRDILLWNDRPLGWQGGFTFSFLSTGSCRVMQDSFNGQGTDDPKAMWDMITEAQCKGVVLMQNDIIRLADEFEHNPPEHKALFIASGGQVVRKELSRVVGLLCQVLSLHYGCSEGGSLTSTTVTQPGQLKDYCCGQPANGLVQIKIVDEEGKELKTGETGEIYVKCDRIVKAYYNLEAPAGSTTTHTDDGWYRTNDRGKLDRDGTLFCFGRASDVTSLNGVIVYLSWLESILNKCPGVQNSCVVALDDDDDDDVVLSSMERNNKEDDDSKDDDGVEGNRGVSGDGDVGVGGGGGNGGRHCGEGSGGCGGGGSYGVVFCGFVEMEADDNNANLSSDDVKASFMENLLETDYKDKFKLAHVFIVDAFPTIPSGKVNRRAMRAMAEEQLRL